MIEFPEWMPFGVAIENIEAGDDLEFNTKTKEVRKCRASGTIDSPNGQELKPKETSHD